VRQALMIVIKMLTIAVWLSLPLGVLVSLHLLYCQILTFSYILCLNEYKDFLSSMQGICAVKYVHNAIFVTESDEVLGSLVMSVKNRVLSCLLLSSLSEFTF